MKKFWSPRRTKLPTKLKKNRGVPRWDFRGSFSNKTSKCLSRRGERRYKKKSFQSKEIPSTQGNATMLITFKSWRWETFSLFCLWLSPRQGPLGEASSSWPTQKIWKMITFGQWQLSRRGTISVKEPEVSFVCFPTSLMFLWSCITMGSLSSSAMKGIQKGKTLRWF